MVLYVLFAIISLSSASILRLPSPPVQVSSGLVRGSVEPGGSHISYTGIPYAVAERFQVPQPAPRWKGILDAHNEHKRCPQKFPKPLVTGEEDCLYLNVYTPLKIRKQLYPVMVFIHGGGFKDGSGSPLIYGPEYLVKRDVILVTFNYRLGVLGFLCLGIKEAQGNMGLKDQVEALRWVKNNIRAFGGDPDNITLFGESAGSASVLYHILSPMSTGLFNRAIMESGSAMSYWATQFEPKEIAFKLVAQLGYTTTDVNEVVSIFKKKPILELMNAEVPRKYGDIVQSENIFVPCIEEAIEGTKRFLTDSPYNIITKGQFNKVPVIMGFNSVEGYLFVGKESRSEISQFNFKNALPRDLQFPSESEKGTTASKFKEIYSGNASELNITPLVKYEGDAGIKYPVIATADLLLKNMEEPVFVYKFAYDGFLNLAKIGMGFGRYPGASHADELLYIFKPQGTAMLSVLETNMIKEMTLMWTNFAKYGNPTPEETPLPLRWQPANPSDPQLLVIDSQLSMESIWHDKDMLFWNQTYANYRRTE